MPISAPLKPLQSPSEILENLSFTSVEECQFAIGQFAYVRREADILIRSCIDTEDDYQTGDRKNGLALLNRVKNREEEMLKCLLLITEAVSFDNDDGIIKARQAWSEIRTLADKIITHRLSSRALKDLALKVLQRVSAKEIQLTNQLKAS